MKVRGWVVNLSLIVAVVLIWGCKAKPVEEAGVEVEKEAAVTSVEDGEGTVVAAESEKVSAPEKVMPKWSRKSAGYARHLPQDTDMYLEVRKLDDLWDLFEDFNVDDVMERLKLDEMAEAAGEDAEKIEKLKAEVTEGVMAVLPAIFGEEVFVSVRGLNWWFQPYLHYSEELYPDIIANMVMEAADGNWFAGDNDEVGNEVTAALLDFVRQQVREVDGKPVLAVQMGGRVSENRAEVMTRLRDWMDLAASEEEVLVKVEFELNGVAWSGLQVDWAEKLFENVSAEEMEDAGIGEQEREELLEMAKELPLVMACGEVGDYVVLSVGLGEHSAETVAEGTDSLVSDEAFEFLSDYELDSVMGISWVSGDLVENYHRTQSWTPIWEGVAKGFAQGERLKSGPELAASFRTVGKLSAEKNAGKAFDEVGALLLKDGLHFESRGGWLGDGVDLGSPMKLAAAFDSWEDPPFFRAHWKGKKEHSDKTLAQFEELAKVVQVIGDEISEVVEEGLEELEELEEDLDEEELDDAEKERQLSELMRRDFLKGVENLWAGYRDHFRESLGSEVAMVVDLDGAAPPIFGLDEETLENGRIPRFAYVRPVIDREGLEKSWDLWRDSGVRFFGLISEMIDTPIPFPDTMSADSNDIRTHFFPMPFATDDFLPSLSVSDEVFVVGTAKSLAAKIDKAVQSVEGEKIERSGMLVEMEMGQFWDFCDAWLQVGVENWGSVKKMTEEDFEALEEPADLEEEQEEDVAEDIEDLLRDKAEPDDPEIEGPVDVEIEVEKPAWADLGEIPFVDMEGLNEPEEYVQWAIDKARWWKGVSYRRWLDDGVPRSSASIHWGDPGEGSE